jgi:hypothetical protein
MNSANSLQIFAAHSHPESDVELGRYPVFSYLFALLLFGIFGYLTYSASGGVGGIPGLNNRYLFKYSDFGGSTSWQLYPC